MRNAACRLCGLGGQGRTTCVWGSGPADAKVFVIGEAPGFEEDKSGKPFQGKSGAILRDALAREGLKDVYITNLVKCRPPDNRTPTKEEIKACRGYLDAEIAEAQPSFVLTLGATASKAVLRKSKITLDHGLVVEMPAFKGMPAFHPAYALRDPSKLPAFQQDVGRFSRLTRGTDSKTDIAWSIVQASNIAQFFHDFQQADEFSFDLETSGLFPHDGRGSIRCLSVGITRPDGSDFGWVVPLEIRGSPFHTAASRRQIMSMLFKMARDKKGIAQNGKFDNQWMSVYYQDVFPLSFDTGLAHHLLDENTPHGLKEMTRTFLDGEDYDLPLKEKLNPTNLMRFYKYAAQDAVYTLRLKKLFSARLAKDRTLRKIFYRLTMRAARAFTEIEQVGLTIDTEKFDRTEIEVRAQLETALAELNSMVGEPINWNSPQQVADVLFNRLGLNPVVFTDKGAASTGEATLVELQSQHPVAAALVRYRELEKFLSTYLEGWRQYIFDGRVYFSYKLHGTVTGRYSSRLHQTPRDGTIRNVIIAPPGWDFVQADFSQAELRIVAEISQDLELITCFRRGIDVHWRTLMSVILSGGAGEYIQPVFDTASKIHGKPVKDLNRAVELLLEAGHEKCISTWKGWKEARKKAKGINFGYVYGMREPKFIEYAKLKYGFEPTMEEATAIRNAYFNLYRGLDPWHKKQKRLVRLNGEVRNLIGRVRRLPGAFSSDRSLVSEAERQSINAPVQGVIGDYKAMALVEIHETMPRDRLLVVGEVHDSILMIIRKDSHELLKKVRKIMERPALLDELGVHLSVPMTADFEIGPWGKGTPFK